MLKYSFLFIFTFAFFTVNSQQLYQILRSDGNIPETFIIKPIDFVEKDISKIQESESGFIRKTSERFYSQSYHMLDYYYRSGRVLFNNDLYYYVNKVADYVLKDFKDLRPNVKLYIINDDEFNAFATNDGTIFICTGLLAKIQSEAQLAFIIAHEVAHYNNNHALDAFIENVKLKNKKDEYKKLNYDIKRVKLSQYSKEQELAADNEGFLKFYLTTDYSGEAVNDLFDITLTSNLPQGSYDTIFDFLRSRSYKLPEKYRLNEFDEISNFDNYNDSLSTHPNIRKRRHNIDSLIMLSKHKGRTNFVVSESDFAKVQRISRFELTHLYLQAHKYEDALCNSFFLLQEYPGNKFSELSLGIALMQIACYKANDDFIYLHDSYQDKKGSSQNLFYLTEKISSEEIGVVALSYMWELKQKNPNCAIVETILDRTIKNVVLDLELNWNEFSDAKSSDDNFYLEAFSNYEYDTNFSNRFSHYEELKMKIKAEKQELINSKEKRRAIAEKNKIIQKKGFALGIDSIVIVNPMSININIKKKDHLQLEVADKMRFKLIDVINNVSKEINLNTEILDIKCMKTDDVALFNDYCLLSNWFSEKSSHHSDNYFIYNKLFTDLLIEKYNTKYFAWVALAQEIGAGASSPTTYVQLHLFDITTGELLFSQKESIFTYENVGMISSNMKKLLLQIKNRRN